MARPYQLPTLDLDNDPSNLAGHFGVAVAALMNELYPGPANQAKWAAAMRLIAIQIETQVQVSEVGGGDDALGFGDLAELDHKANRLRRILGLGRPSSDNGASES